MTDLKPKADIMCANYDKRQKMQRDGHPDCPYLCDICAIKPLVNIKNRNCFRPHFPPKETANEKN